MYLQYFLKPDQPSRWMWFLTKALENFTKTQYAVVDPFLPDSIPNYGGDVSEFASHYSLVEELLPDLNWVRICKCDFDSQLPADNSRLPPLTCQMELQLRWQSCKAKSANLQPGQLLPGITRQVPNCQTRMSLCQDLPSQQTQASSFKNKSQFRKISQTTMRGLNLIQHFSTPVSWNAWYWIWFIKRVTTVEFLVDSTCVF